MPGQSAITSGMITITVDGATVGTVSEFDFKPDLVKEIKIPRLGRVYPMNLTTGREIRLSFTKVLADDTFWDKFCYTSYPNYSKELGETKLVFVNTVGGVAKTHTLTITGPQIMKWSLSKKSGDMIMESVEIVGTGCTVVTA